jgi:hypothetical protein
MHGDPGEELKKMVRRRRDGPNSFLHGTQTSLLFARNFDERNFFLKLQRHAKGGKFAAGKEHLNLRVTDQNPGFLWIFASRTTESNDKDVQGRGPLIGAATLF